MPKLPQPTLEDDEAPTLKRTLPAELRDAQGSGAVHATAYVTTKLRKAEIEALLTRERQQAPVRAHGDGTPGERRRGERASGMRCAVSEDEIERYERETRETLPAPPDASAERDDPLAAGRGRPPPLPAGLADLDAEDEG